MYEAHQYFDGDGSSNYAMTYAQQGAYAMIGADEVQPFLAWLMENNVKGFVGEFGIPGNDPLWLPVLDNFLTSIQSAGVPGTYWMYQYHLPTDPFWWPDYEPLSIRTDNGQPNPQLPILAGLVSRRGGDNANLACARSLSSI